MCINEKWKVGKSIEHMKKNRCKKEWEDMAPAKICQIRKQSCHLTLVS